jgi:hypothetical protein
MLVSYRSGFVHHRYMSGSGILFTVVAHHLLCKFHREWIYVNLTIKGENVGRSSFRHPKMKNLKQKETNKSVHNEQGLIK